MALTRVLGCNGPQGGHRQMKQTMNATPSGRVDQEALVPVQRAWNAWRVAHARLRDLEDVHWFQPPGAPRLLLHAYLSAASIVTGSLVDASEASHLPERLLVCVIKCHTTPATYSTLATRADSSPLKRV
jgi:hypothetical protein